MPKFRVSGFVPVWCSIVVEAEDGDQATEIADEQWPGLTDYSGNGATRGRLIGHSQEGVEINAPDDTPEWDVDETEEVEGV